MKFSNIIADKKEASILRGALLEAFPTINNMTITPGSFGRVFIFGFNDAQRLATSIRSLGLEADVSTRNGELTNGMYQVSFDLFVPWARRDRALFYFLASRGYCMNLHGDILNRDREKLLDDYRRGRTTARMIREALAEADRLELGDKFFREYVLKNL